MRSHTQNKGAKGIDAAMALKGLLVLILGIVVTYLAATFVVTTGGMIMAAAAGERVFAMSSTQLQPFANALLARYPRWVSAARYAVTFIPFALWARALRRRASQDAGGAPEKPAVRFGAGVLRGKDVATLVMVAVGLHGLSALIATMVGATMPWLLESYGKIVDQSGLEAYGADWFLSLVFGAPVVEEAIFRGSWSWLSARVRHEARACQRYPSAFLWHISRKSVSGDLRNGSWHVFGRCLQSIQRARGIDAGSCHGEHCEHRR